MTAVAQGFEATCRAESMAARSLRLLPFAIVAPPRQGDGMLTVEARVAASVRDPRPHNDSDRHRVRLVGRPH